MLLRFDDRGIQYAAEDDREDEEGGEQEVGGERGSEPEEDGDVHREISGKQDFFRLLSHSLVTILTLGRVI